MYKLDQVRLACRTQELTSWHVYVHGWERVCCLEVGRKGLNWIRRKKEKRNTKVRLVPSGFDDQAFLFSTKSRHLSNTAVQSNASAELMKSFKTCYNVALLHGHEKCIFETPHNEIKCVFWKETLVIQHGYTYMVWACYNISYQISNNIKHMEFIQEGHATANQNTGVLCSHLMCFGY